MPERKRDSIAISLFLLAGVAPIYIWSLWDWATTWFAASLIIFTPLFVAFRIFEVTTEGEPEITEEQMREFSVHAKRRRQKEKLVLDIIVLGMGVWCLNAFVLGSRLPEWVISLCGLLVLVGVLLLAVSVLIMPFINRCPYCKHLDGVIDSGKGRRCLYCHRDIDVW